MEDNAHSATPAEEIARRRRVAVGIAGAHSIDRNRDQPPAPDKHTRNGAAARFSTT
jgi:hypothetical protein